MTGEFDDADFDAVDSGSLHYEPSDAIFSGHRAPEIAEPFRTDGEPVLELAGLLTGSHEPV